MEKKLFSNFVVSNLFWRFSERIGAQLVQFIVQIVLARILLPNDYGTIALINVFIIIFQVFVDSGLGNALIQKKDSDDIDFSTVFYTNIIFCIFLYGLLFIFTPFIADFYNNKELIPLIRVLGLTIVISGVKNVQQSYVSKNMMFRKFFFATLIGTIISALVSIWMAYNGAGVWSLVAQQLINLSIDTLMLWFSVKWRPIKAFSFVRLKCMFKFGWKLLVSALIDTIYNNVRQLIIGKIYSKDDLAYFNRGKQFPLLIIGNINTSIDSVLLPTMAKVQESKTQVKSMTRRAIKTSTYIIAPLMFGLVFCADTVVSLILTDKWLPAVPYLRVFCISYLFYPIHTANLNALKAMGRSDLFLILEIIKKVIGIIILLSTMWLGVKIIAYSLIVSSILSQIVNSWPNKRLMSYGYLEQLNDILPSIILAVLMGVVVHFIGFVSLPLIAKFCIQVIVGAIIYISFSVLFKLESFYYILDIIAPIFKRIKKVK